VSWACPGDMLAPGHVSWACPGCVLECVLECVLAVSSCVLACVLAMVLAVSSGLMCVSYPLPREKLKKCLTSHKYSNVLDERNKPRMCG
jgi:hypothetical protein